MTLDTKDILLIVVSIVVSLCASWIANFSTPSMLSLFKNRKARSMERNKDRALSHYVRLWEVHTGNKDKFLFFLPWLMVFLVCFFCSILILLIGIVAFDTVFYMKIATMIMALLLFMVGGITGSNMIFWCERLNNFDQYTKDFEAKFGRPNVD